jgi:hypothetical protein
MALKAAELLLKDSRDFLGQRSPGPQKREGQCSASSLVLAVGADLDLYDEVPSIRSRLRLGRCLSGAYGMP